MMESRVVIALLSLIAVICVDIPDYPAINNIETWVPVKYEQLEPLPMPPITTSWEDPNAEIFVGVSHYRDSRCSETIANLLTKAKFPDRIKIGIVQQIHTEKDDFDCVKDYCSKYTSRGEQCPHRPQIQQIEFTHHDARGTAYARYQQNSLIEDEEFCMQVDSHSDVIKDWDVVLTRMWASTKNEYAVLSGPPVDIPVLRDNANSDVVPHLCQATFDSRGMLVNLPPVAAVHLSKPILSPLYNAGFSFAKCHFEKKVPNDPNYQMIFDADEFTKYARLFTRGYDVYTPNQIVVAHDYNSAMQRKGENKNPLEWVNNGMTPEFARSLYDHSVARIATLLGYPEGSKDVVSVSLLTNYGLGNKRTLSQLIDFTGIDLRKKVIFGDRCMELQWVPFKFDKDPNTAEGDIWGQAPEMLLKGGPNIPILKSGSVEVFSEKIFSESVTELNERKQRALTELSNVQAANDAASAAVASGAEPKHLRSTGVKGIEELGEEVVLEIENEFRHRGKELWWIFQSVDTAVEALMNHIDEEIGMGHGHRVVKLILLLAPIFIFVFGGAIWMMTSGSKSKLFVDNHKKI